jgi:O-antigen ligase
MADVDRRMSALARGLPASARLAALLPWALLIFVAAAFLLPTGPAYSLVFYALVVAPAVAASVNLPARLTPARLTPARLDPGTALASLLILWSGLTLIWGQDDGHRSVRFAVDTLMTLVFLAAMLGGLATPGQRDRLCTVLIWAGAANAMFSIAIGFAFPQPSERLHGWGATSHPILGASVMGLAYLAALCRTLTRPEQWGRYLAACAAMALFILFTESRGPMLAVFASTLFLCAAGPWRWRALGRLAALAVAWRLLPAGMRQHQAAVMVARGSSHRFEIWHRTLELIGQRPLAGHGLAANLDMPGITFPHDMYLSVLFYSGAVGFALFAGLAGFVCLRLWQGRTTQGWARADWLWLVAIWMNALLAGLTDLGQITKGPGPMWFIFWLPVGLVLAAPWVRPGALSPPAAA